MIALRLLSAFLLAIAFAAATGFQGRAATAPLRVLVTVPAAPGTKPLDGRLLLLLSTDERTEPRFQVSDGDRTAQVFGVDVDGLAPGREVAVDASVLGYPVQSLGDIKPGEYWVQGLLHVYETFTRSDGQTVKLPPDRDLVPSTSSIKLFCSSVDRVCPR